MPSSFSTTWIKHRWLDYVDTFIRNVSVYLHFSRKKMVFNAGPAIAIGELGDCLGRQMGWGRPLASPLDILPISHSENNKQIKTCLLIMIILGRPFSHTFTCQPDF